jgi:hypothetical protein
MIKVQLQLHKQLESNIITENTEPLEILYQFENLIRQDLLQDLDKEKQRNNKHVSGGKGVEELIEDRARFDLSSCFNSVGHVYSAKLS